jgi:hypothetical protein
MISGKERILNAIAGEKVDRVPFIPNIWQWFYVNKEQDNLPEHLHIMEHPVDVLRWMGADIFSKFEGDVRQPIYHECQYEVEFENPVAGTPPWASFTSFECGTKRKERIITPHGELSHAWEYRSDTGAPFEIEHWWKNFDEEYDAIRAWMLDTEWTYDKDALKKGLKLIGEDGIVLFQLLPTPLKQLHWLAGQDKSSYFIMDHPDEMRELARIHEQKSLEFLEQVIDLDTVMVFEIPDNVDSAFYPPYWFEEFCLPILKREAQMVHDRGKYLFLHSCGHLKALANLFIQSEVDCVEGQAPPPIGDWYLHEARALSELLIVCGGMAAPEQELQTPDRSERLDNYVKTLFESMGDKRRFLFGSSCNTSPRTDLENLIFFRDAAWKYGDLA